MSQIVQARCPHCKSVLRIPAQWLQQPMRCKYCQQIFQAKGKAAPAPAQPAAPAPLPGPANLPAPVLAPPAAVPPAAVPPGGPAFDFSGPSQPNSYRYRKRGGRRWVPIVVGLAFVVSAGIAAAVFGPQLLEMARGKSDKHRGQQAKNKDISPKDSGTTPTPPPPVDKTNPDKSPPDKNPKHPEPDPTKNPPDKNPPDKNPPDKTPPDKTPKDPKVEVNPPDPPKDPLVKPKGPKYEQKYFPRRALAISVNDYLLANPLTYGRIRKNPNPGSCANSVLKAFGNYFLKFPNTQLFELSDPPDDEEKKFREKFAAAEVVPLKPVIENAVTRFLATSRPQDRVVIFFAGHIAKDDKENAYLVPIEGDLDDAKTLIPLTWVFDQLKNANVRQKLLILDVCRFNPARGNERPGGDPLDEAIEKKLQQPPEGVQVWVSCSKDQQSIEYEMGSLFQEALCVSMNERLGSIPNPQDPLPVEDLVQKVNKYLEDRLSADKKQVSRLYGKEVASGAAFDPNEAAAARFDLALSALSTGLAGKAVIKGIVDEIQAIPPARMGKGTGKERLRIEDLPFQAKVLDEYGMDGYAREDEFMNKEKDFPIRAIVVKTKRLIRAESEQLKLRESFNGKTTKQLKDQVSKEQTAPAKTIFDFEEALADLEDAKKFIKQEPSKRWRAHYYFTLAELKSRLIYVMEYNNALAEIRKDSLELPKGAAGFQLAAIEKPACKEGKVRQWSKDLKKLWPKIIDDFPDTPWALLARREKDASMGLEWRPIKN